MSSTGKTAHTAITIVVARSIIWMARVSWSACMASPACSMASSSCANHISAIWCTLSKIVDEPASSSEVPTRNDYGVG